MLRDLNYNDFISGIEKTGERLPLYGQIELTHRCNYDCIHCYCEKEAQEEAGVYFWKDIISQIYGLGGLELTFTGGEPLLYKDFREVYGFAKKNGFLINIFSNGYYLDGSILDFLRDNPPVSIEITLNSLRKENYERIVQKKNTFKRVIENIRQIKKRGLPLILKCNGLKENKDEILKIKRFTENLLGKKRFKFDSLLFPMLNGEKEPISHRLTSDEIREIEREDDDMLIERERQLKHQQPLFNPKGLYHCNSWRTHYFINPQGILQFCHLTKEYSTNLKKEPFKRGFDKFPDIIKEGYQTDSSCINCQYKDYCYHCPSRAYLEVGNKEEPVDYYCQLAKARKDSKREVTISS